MSARRLRKQARSNSSGGDSIAPGGGISRYSDFLLMALAIFAGRHFSCELLYRPASFYCAVQQFEARSLADREAGGARLMRISWENLRDTVRVRLNEGSLAQCRDALDAMFRSIVGSASGGIDAASAMDAKRKDPHNDLSTLAAAMVILAADADAAPPAGGPGEKARNDFQKLSSIIELVSVDRRRGDVSKRSQRRTARRLRRILQPTPMSLRFRRKRSVRSRYERTGRPCR